MSPFNRQAQMNVCKEYEEINYIWKWELGNKLYQKYADGNFSSCNLIVEAEENSKFQKDMNDIQIFH